MTHNESQNTENLKNELARAQRDFSILYEVSHAMRTTLDLNHILYIILTGVTAHSGLGFNRAILFLANKKRSFLEPKMAIGPKSGEHAQKIWEHISSSNQRLDDLIKEDKLAQNTDQTSLFQSIKDLQGSLSKALPPEGLQEQVTFTPPITLPALVIAYQLFGNISKEQEIVEENLISHPGFVPGGEPIQVSANG